LAPERFLRWAGYPETNNFSSPMPNVIVSKLGKPTYARG